MITFKNVQKVYKSKETEVHALNGINLTVEEGEIYGVIGFSGAGKSSLIRCVNLLENPTSGQIFVDGVDLTTLPSRNLREAKRKIGMVFQHFNLLNSKTVFENVAMPLLLSGTPKKVIQERVDELLTFVGLVDKKHAFPDQLSGGQKQRVGIARALATKPSVLLCDEATSALDPQTTSAILQLLKKINQDYNITILLITHEMSVIRDICDKVAVMEDGKIIEQGTVFDIFSNPKTQTAQNFVQSVMNDKLPAFVEKIIENKGSEQGIYQLHFVGEDTCYPFLSNVAKKFEVDVNVLFGNITELQGIPFGKIVVELTGESTEIQKALRYIELEKVSVKDVRSHAS